MTVKTERLALRVTEKQWQLLAAASKTEGRTVTDFVLRHATYAAEEVLADRRVLGLRRLMRAQTVLDE